MQKNSFSGLVLARSLILSSISMLLFCAGFFTLPLGVAAMIFSPVPLALLGAREGKVLMTWGIFGVALGLTIGFSPMFALSFLLGHGLLCFGLALPLGKLEKGSESLLFCIIVSIASKLLFVAVSVALTGYNPYAIDPAAVQNMHPGMLRGLSQEQLNHAVNTIVLMFPFFIIVYSMLDSFVNYKLCEALQRRHEVKFPPLPPFGEWRFPISFLYVFVFAFVLPLIVEDNETQLWRMLELNLKFIVNLFFMLQGLSLVWWMSGKLTENHSFLLLPLRVMLIGLLVMPVFSTWMTALGLLDMCFDLRSKKLKRT